MTDTDPEVERIAELASRAWRGRVGVYDDDWTKGYYADDWRAVARAVIADRASQPPGTDGPTLTAVADERDDAMAAHVTAECVTAVALTRAVAAERERDDARRELRRTVADCDRTVADARRERDAARTRAVGTERERDALRARLDALSCWVPSDDTLNLMREAIPGDKSIMRAHWRAAAIVVRDALLTAQEPPANRVGGDRDAAIISAPSMGTSCGCKPYEPCAGHQELESAFDWQERAAELLRENDALRQQLRDQAREAGELITQGREAERAAVVAWLRRLPYDTYAFVAADQIVDGDHLAAKGKP